MVKPQRYEIKVSVIIPIYNVQDYLQECLDTVCKQNEVDMEVILVNDGSTDDSLSVCKEYAQRKSNVIVINKENGGLSDARNVGTKAATGDYIFYLDSDDWLAPDAIKSLYEFAIENDCEIVQGGYYYAYDDHLLYDNKYKKSFVWDRHEAMLELIKNDYVKNFAWGKLYRADIVKKYQFPKGKYYEDSYWQHLIVHECKRYGVVPNPLYYYRQRNSGISGEFSLKNLDLLRGYEERLAFVQEKYPEYTRHIVSILWNTCYNMVELAKQKNDNGFVFVFQNYLEEINKEYELLLKQYMYSEVKYVVALFFPRLMPLYNFSGKLLNYIVNILFCSRYVKEKSVDNSSCVQ